MAAPNQAVVMWAASHLGSYRHRLSKDSRVTTFWSYAVLGEQRSTNIAGDKGSYCDNLALSTYGDSPLQGRVLIYGETQKATEPMVVMSHILCIILSHKFIFMISYGAFGLYSAYFHC